METPNWHGHCNGWAAAAIRHAEPQNSVRRNGVTFTPADIKGLLAEVYIYNDLEYLVGQREVLNAGAFHAAIANWLGRGQHPLGMEADPGPEKWNYPVYGYTMSSTKRSDRAVDVRLDVTYAKDSNGEYQKSPRYSRVKTFRYRLDLNENGEIVGGVFYSGSAIIDMLWLPLRPKQGTRERQRAGQPAPESGRSAEHLAGIGAGRTAGQMAGDRSAEGRSNPGCLSTDGLGSRARDRRTSQHSAGARARETPPVATGCRREHRALPPPDVAAGDRRRRARRATIVAAIEMPTARLFAKQPGCLRLPADNLFRWSADALYFARLASHSVFTGFAFALALDRPLDRVAADLPLVLGGHLAAFAFADHRELHLAVLARRRR